MTSYYEKIVVTGGIAEVWRYEKLNTLGGGNPEGKTADGKDKKLNYQQRQKIRRDRIRRLACSNFDAGSKFVTLTFRDDVGHDIRNVQQCNLYFKNFILRLKYRYADLKYLAVIEFQDSTGRGAVHYHMICNIPFIRKQDLEDIWKGGFVQINKIDHVDNVGAYVVKYMCKDTEDPRLMGENAYLHSRGLNEPQVFCTWGNRNDWESWHSVIEKETPSYSAEYESESGGLIEYRQFNFNRKQNQNQGKSNLQEG